MRPLARSIAFLVAAGILTAFVAVLVAVAVGPRLSGETPLGPAGSIEPIVVPAGAVVLVGAGDIARCDSTADEATARLLDTVAGTVFAAGDNAYERGSRAQFRDCYDPSWGRHRARTLPVAGNHDWETAGAAGYIDYFGAAARPDGRTWYSTTVGAWHVVILDSNCERVGGCGPDSEQARWLVDDLREDSARCTVAIWHHPRFSSGQHGSDPRFDAFWRALFEDGADIVISGHDHDYEVFAPQDPTGTRDDAAGIRAFVVGTGGAALRAFDEPVANSEVRNATSHGVLRLALWPDRYEWQFIPVAGREFTDQGSAACH